MENSDSRLDRSQSRFEFAGIDQASDLFKAVAE